MPLNSHMSQNSAVNSVVGQHNNAKTNRETSGFVGRLKTWNKDVVCLPFSREKHQSIPRGKQQGMLAERGLIGKIRLMSTWNAHQVIY